MAAPILSTKLYLPQPRPGLIDRPRLSERLSAGLRRPLTLVTAPAGFGKTTLLAAWLAGEPPAAGPPGQLAGAAWLALDEADSDPGRFLAYLIAAARTLAPGSGAGALGALQSTQPPPPEAIVAALINDLAALPGPFALVLDDYHLIDSPAIDAAIALLIDRMPPQMRLVIAARDVPRLPLARLRARGQLTELRADDLRFTADEAAAFLNQALGPGLTPAQVEALERRTEGWVAGLQLAAISLRGQRDAAAFIGSFAGGHRFVLDYLAEEVLARQPERIQRFLLRTSILGRLCGPLCDALDASEPPGADAPGQATLEYLDRANLFITPLDDERRWYRYHHLFAEALLQRLRAAAPGEEAELRLRASAWLEANGFELEAFQQAAAAGAVDRAARLAQGGPMPLIFRGAAAPVLAWLEGLPEPALDARPALRVMRASALLFVSRPEAVEPQLRAAEAALAGAAPGEATNDLIGHIALIRATVAVTRHQAAVISEQAERALAHLSPANLPVRAAATWALGCARQLQGDRAGAGRAYAESLAASAALGHRIIELMSTIALGELQEAGALLDAATDTYRRAIALAGDPPSPVICQARLGLARISYERNELAAAEEHGREAALLARQVPTTDRGAACAIMLARLRAARGDLAGAAALLAEAGELAGRLDFAERLPEIAAEQALLALRRGDLPAAWRHAQAAGQPLGRARVLLAMGDPAAALAAWEQAWPLAEERDEPAERLRVLLGEALALQAAGDQPGAAQRLGEALTIGETYGFIRSFLEEGPAGARLLAAADHPYARALLAAGNAPGGAKVAPGESPEPLPEPLTRRELAVLRLVAQGRSNQEIGEQLFLALDTIKGHNRQIFAKLGVRRRTEAVARARALGLL